MEKEAKFPVPDPLVWEQIAQAVKVSGLDQIPRGREAQHNVYFDTPDGALARAAYACRLREVAGRRTLAVKGPAQAKREVLCRYEAEFPVGPESLPNGVPLASIVLELLPAEVREKVSPLGPLAVILRSGTDRRIFGLEKAGRRVCELCLDEVNFEVEGREVPVYRELELELKDGTEAEQVRLVRWFREQWGLSTTGRSKLEVGLELTGRSWPPEP